MKKTLVLSMVLALFAGVSAVSAQEVERGNFGAGIIIGEPTGISLKLWLNDTNAIDLAGGWNLRRDNFYTHFDYLFHFYRIDLDTGGLIPFYSGIGAKFDFAFDANDELDMEAGVRVPVGFSYMFATTPLELFLEIAPTINFIPETEVDFGGGVGIRYYF